jgi:hypothetical protein
MGSDGELADFVSWGWVSGPAGSLTAVLRIATEYVCREGKRCFAIRVQGFTLLCAHGLDSAVVGAHQQPTSIVSLAKTSCSAPGHLI